MHKTLVFFLLLSSSCAQSQNDVQHKLIGGLCEGCEAIFENKDGLTNMDTLPDYLISKDKLVLSGTVYQPDGKTPAGDVVLYIYHTNADGIYPTTGSEKGWARRHGYLRGWIKTNADGKYAFYTSKPGFYPSRTDPAHIHITVLEPDGSYYWIHDTVFDDDPLVTQEQRERKTRGGNSGVLALKENAGIFLGHRDIILRKNL